MASSPSDAPRQRLEHFPIAIFSTVMGIAGLAIAWLKAQAVLGLPIEVGEGLRTAASGLFVLLLLIYGLKALRYPQAVGLDMRHPIRINFFPTISISLLLLAIAYLQAQPEIARWLWIIGAALHFSLTLAIFSSWIHHTHYDIKHVNPAWFIPVVGNISVTVAGIHLAAPELSWFFFSIGLVFWIVLLTIVLKMCIRDRRRGVDFGHWLRVVAVLEAPERHQPCSAKATCAATGLSVGGGVGCGDGCIPTSRKACRS